jgi:hypothetical protein
MSKLSKILSDLKSIEAALSDIGDADREPEDDVAWLENRAAVVIPTARKLLTEIQRLIDSGFRICKPLE